MKDKVKDEYSAFQMKLLGRFLLYIVLSVLIVAVLYQLLWKERLGDVTVSLLAQFFRLGHEEAFLIYHNYFRGYKEVIFVAALMMIFILLLWRLFQWMKKYFKEINQGIDILLADDETKIYLSLEMQPFERKLNAVKQSLEQRKAEAAAAEHRKDELVMYLAHDIRTPLTSIIGYLNLLEESLDMPIDQQAKNLHIVLEKAYHLEKMINELFEITRYNSQQIKIRIDKIDLSFMLVQLTDELFPIFSQHGNTVTLNTEEDLIVYGDAEKLARAFSNILKNAASYSDPDTEIKISAKRSEQMIKIMFQNKGETIPKDKLNALFDKFYRLDEARKSDTGGTGLGLAIAKEIVLLHEGTIQAISENNINTFMIKLPQSVQNNFIGYS